MRIAILTANTQIYKRAGRDKAGKVIREIVEASRTSGDICQSAAAG